MKKLSEINQNIIFFIIFLSIFLLFRYNNPNQVVERHFKKENELHYNVLKYTLLIIKIMIALHLRLIILHYYNSKK